MSRRITDAQLANASRLAESGEYRTVRELAQAAEMSEWAIRKYGIHTALPGGENAPSIAGIDLTLDPGDAPADAWRRGFQERSNTALCSAHLMDMQLGGAEHWERMSGVKVSGGQISRSLRAREAIRDVLEEETRAIAVRRRQEGGTLPIDNADPEWRDDVDCKWAAQHLEATAGPYTPQDISDLVVRRRRQVYGEQDPRRPSIAALQRRVLHKIATEECSREWQAQHGAAAPVWALDEIYDEVEGFIATVGLGRNGS